MGSGFPALLPVVRKAFPDLSLISLEQSKNDEYRGNTWPLPPQSMLAGGRGTIPFGILLILTFGF